MIRTIDGIDYEVNDENLMHECDYITILPGERRSVRKIYQVSQRKYLDNYTIYSMDENNNWKDRVGFECIINLSDYRSYLGQLMEIIEDSNVIINRLYDKKLELFIKENWCSDSDKHNEPIKPVKSNVTDLSDNAHKHIRLNNSEPIGTTKVIQFSDYLVR